MAKSSGDFELENEEGEEIEGEIQSINRANTGLKIDGEWYNYTKPEWRGERWDRHAVGDNVTLGLDNSGKFVRTVAVERKAKRQPRKAQTTGDTRANGGQERPESLDPTRTSIERQTALKVAGEIVVAGLNKGVIEDMQKAGDWLVRLGKLVADVVREQSDGKGI